MITEFNSYMSNIDIDFFKELCLKHGELRHYKKNEFILHEGDACSFFGFILSGVVKYSCINRTENKPYNVGFSFPNEFIGDYPTCLYGRVFSRMFQLLCSFYSRNILYISKIPSTKSLIFELNFTMFFNIVLLHRITNVYQELMAIHS